MVPTADLTHGVSALRRRSPSPWMGSLRINQSLLTLLGLSFFLLF